MIKPSTLRAANALTRRVSASGRPSVEAAKTATWRESATSSTPRKTAAENGSSTDAINKALDQLFADGTMHKLSQEIFQVDMVSAAQKLH